MTQGSIMNPNTTPAAVVGAVIPTQKTIVQTWRERREHTSLEHAFYALARLNFGAHKRYGDDYSSKVNSAEFVTDALTKMAWTFSPTYSDVKRRSGVSPFRTLLNMLNTFRQPHVKAELWNVSVEEMHEIRNLASQLYMEARMLGDKSLFALAPPKPAPREKKPYVRPEA